MSTRSDNAASKLRRLVGDLRQLASVRRLVLAEGQEGGIETLAFSTGGGLDFWVFCGRSFDVGPLWWRGTPIAWHGPNGFASPMLHHAESDRGYGFERVLGGFLVTCGLDHIRQPRPEEGLPLHGRFPFLPGRLLSYGENWDTSTPMLFCEGEVTQARLHGERLRLRRRIEAPIGRNVLTIRDEVRNIGAREEAVAILYHMNFGFPIVGRGTKVRLDGEEVMEPVGGHVSTAAEPAVECFRSDPAGTSACVLRRERDGTWGGLEAKVSWSTATLPYVQIWNDRRPYTNILAIEPVTSQRTADGGSTNGPVLAPNEALRTSLSAEFADV